MERWFGAMYGRPAYRGTAGDYYSHAHGLPPQLGGCAFNPAGEAGAGALGGAAGAAGAWRLPLPPLTWASSPEPYPAALDRPAADALRAAARLADNAAAVAGFAARGPAHAAGAARRTVASRLCDPSVPPDAAALPEVDAALRRVAARLLATAAGEPQPEAWRRQPLGERAGAVAASLAYMRDRICVPRDLPFPAARQLRAHLNAEIDSVEAEGGGA